MVREIEKLGCPKCAGTGADKYGKCNVCDGSKLVRPFAMSQPCRRCDSKSGYIRKAGPNNVAYCATINCWDFVYCPSKAETGEEVRQVRSRPDLPGGARDFVLSRANYRCELCGRGSETTILHVAHALSVAECKAQKVPEEYWNHYSNLLCACEECNLDMGSRSLEPRLLVRLLIARMRSGKKL